MIRAFDDAVGFAKRSSDRVVAAAMDELKRMRQARSEKRTRAAAEREEAVSRACHKSNEKVESTKALLLARESLTASLQTQLSEERAKTAELQEQVSRIEAQATYLVSEERLRRTEVIADQLREKNAALKAEVRKRTADIASMKETLKGRNSETTLSICWFRQMRLMLRTRTARGGRKSWQARWMGLEVVWKTR